jgi:hypothetical protein
VPTRTSRAISVSKAGTRGVVIERRLGVRWQAERAAAVEGPAERFGYSVEIK